MVTVEDGSRGHGGGAEEEEETEVERNKEI
jgi:hypothetical protein